MWSQVYTFYDQIFGENTTFKIFSITDMILFFLIYFCLCWVFIAVSGLPVVVVSRAALLRGVSFLLQWLLLLQRLGSRQVGFSSCVSWALERRQSSCDS